MAFIVTALLAPARPHAGRARTHLPRGARVSPRRARWAATLTPDVPDATESSEPEESGAYSPPSLELDTEMIKEKAAAVVSDVSARPGYYGKLVGYGLGALVAATILQAIVGAIDAIPVLPSALELVGLGYTAWFVWRYVLFKESREELMDEIEDLVGRARPPPSE